MAKLRAFLTKDVPVPETVRSVSKATLEAIAMGFANAVLQLGLWLTGSRFLERFGRFVTSESEFYQWGAILMLNPVLWGIATALWVLLLRMFRRVEDWKVLIGVPLAGASCFTVILLALVAIT